MLELWYITLECNFTCTLVMNHLKKLNVLFTKRVHTPFNEIKEKNNYWFCRECNSDLRTILNHN